MLSEEESGNFPNLGHTVSLPLRPSQIESGDGPLRRAKTFPVRRRQSDDLSLAGAAAPLQQLISERTIEENPLPLLRALPALPRTPSLRLLIGSLPPASEGTELPCLARDLSTESQDALRRAGALIPNQYAAVARLLLQLVRMEKNGDLTCQDRRGLVASISAGRLEEAAAIVGALQKANPERPRICAICFEETPADKMLRMGCGEHFFCVDCLSRHVEVCIRESSCPRCPAPSCRYSFVTDDIRRCADDELFAQWDQLQLKVCLQTDSEFHQCPGVGCQYPILVDPSIQRIHCPSCCSVYCGKCRHPVHRSDVPCEAWEANRALWMDWLGSGCLDYHSAQSTTEAAHNVTLLTLIQSELFKAKNCRLCPSCKRIINKDGGCGMMVCGKDGDTGKSLSGCGHQFMWEQALQYKGQGAGNLGEAERRLEVAQVELRSTSMAKHAETPCYICGVTEILGPRFRCVQCDEVSIDICAECSFVVTERHPHVFQFMTAPNKDKEVDSEDVQDLMSRQDPRLNAWGRMMAAACGNEETWFVLAALTMCVDDGSLAWHQNLEILNKVRPYIMHEWENIQWWEADLNDSLGQQLSRRYRPYARVSTPCVAAIEPRTRKLLRLWDGEELSRFASRCQDEITELVLKHTEE